MTMSNEDILSILSPMKTVYASTEDEVNAHKDRMLEEGYMLAGISNAGLKEGFRLTFLPKSAFKESKDD